MPNHQAKLKYLVEKSPTGNTQRATETILLVEDYVDLREVGREFLAAVGCTILEAGSLDDAVAIARDHTGKIDLLLNDVILPSGSGGQIAEELRLLRPDIAVLFMSGYTDSFVAQHGALDPGTVLLQKPFTRNQLLSFVRETLDAQNARFARQSA